MKIFIIHPGIQHSYRLANALQETALFDKVYLFTSVLYHSDKKPFLKSFQKRVKPIHAEVIIKNHILYELFSKTTRNIYNRMVINPNKQVHNNPIYFWQFIFGVLCLPRIWWHRQDLMLVTYETAAWPIVFFAKKWNITVVMDFPSISHESAKALGINETDFGITIKEKERQYIDFALFCSDFCRKSFGGLTSSLKDFVLYLGAEKRENQESSIKMGEVESGKWKVESLEEAILCSKNEEEKSKIKISFIANLEYRKGLDILLDALYSYEYEYFLEVHLIGKIRTEWVEKHLPQNKINTHIQLVYKSAMSQHELFAYLNEQKFDLNLQPSRFDSFAMVVPETMMQGVPNIVSPFVGAGEMLKNGIDGYVMESLSASCLAKSIQHYLALSPTEKQQLKLAVQQSAEEMTWDNYGIAVKNTFITIINS